MSKIISMLTGVLLCTSLLQAQDNSQPADTLEMEKIIVTASKVPVSTRETTRPVVVIDQTDISQNSGKDLSQLLNEYTGILVNGAYSNPAKDKALYLQGASLKYTVILLDGLPVNDPSGTGGLIDLRAIPLSSIERIEIVKGGMSTLYGTDAMAGVINVITKKAPDESLSLNGLLSYGSFETYNGAVGLSGIADRFSYSVNYNREGTEGISDAEQPAGQNADYDKDGFTRDAVQAKMGFSPAEGLELTPFLNYTTFEGGYDDGSFTDADNTYRIDLMNPGLKLHYSLDDFSVQGSYSYTRTDRSFESTFGVFEGKGRMHNADVFAVDNLSDLGRFVLGINYQEFSIEDGDDAVDNPSAGILSPYVNFIVDRFSRLNLEIGTRVNRHSEFGTNLTYAYAASYNLTEVLGFHTSFSTGFRAPTLNELFGPFGANPDLDPETSKTFDAGIDMYLMENRMSVSALYFNRIIEDLIFYDFALGYMNMGKEKARGVELESQWIAGEGISIRGYFNFQKLDDDAYRRPEYASGLAFNTMPVEGLVVNLSGTYVGKRNDLFFNTADFSSTEVELDPYLLLNLYAEYGLPSLKSHVFLDVKNLLNSDYTEVYGFSTQGTAFNAGLRFRL